MQILNFWFKDLRWSFDIFNNNDNSHVDTSSRISFSSKSDV